MPRVGVFWLLSVAPLRAGTTYAYPSWFAPIVELDRLPGKPSDELYVRGIIVVPAGTCLTSWRRYPLILRVSRWRPSGLLRPCPIDMPGPWGTHTVVQWVAWPPVTQKRRLIKLDLNFIRRELLN
jgi:hypothetical protein